MNKILRDGDKLFLNSDIDSLEIINGEVIIYINDLDDFKININLLDNSKVLIYDYSTKNVNKEIYISQENNTYLRYVHTFRVDGKYNLKYLVNLNGDNNTNDIFISGVSNGDVVLDIDGKVESKSSDNVLNENIKVLTNKGKCFVAPKLHISALNVLANHNTAISIVR